jgi:hypothetical protein
MTLWTALLLSAASAAGPDETLPAELRWEEGAAELEGFVRIRGGAWASRGFDFEAIRADSKLVRSNGDALWSGGVDAGLVFGDHLVVFASYELSLTDDVTADFASACVGWREKGEPDAAPGVPDEVTLYAGAGWGRFEVDASGFGDFEPAAGLRAGLAITWKATRGLWVSVVGEYRLIEFDYEEDILEGDDQAGGSTLWIGLGLDFRY